MLVIKSNKEATFLTKDYAAELAKIPEEKFYNLVQAANTALNDLRYTNQQQIPLDVFCGSSHARGRRKCTSRTR